MEKEAKRLMNERSDVYFDGDVSSLDKKYLHLEWKKNEEMSFIKKSSITMKMMNNRRKREVCIRFHADLCRRSFDLLKEYCIPAIRNNEHDTKILGYLKLFSNLMRRSKPWIEHGKFEDEDVIVLIYKASFQLLFYDDLLKLNGQDFGGHNWRHLDETEAISFFTRGVVYLSRINDTEGEWAYQKWDCLFTMEDLLKDFTPNKTLSSDNKIIITWLATLFQDMSRELRRIDTVLKLMTDARESKPASHFFRKRIDKGSSLMDEFENTASLFPDIKDSFFKMENHVSSTVKDVEYLLLETDEFILNY